MFKNWLISFTTIQGHIKPLVGAGVKMINNLCFLPFSVKYVFVSNNLIKTHVCSELYHVRL